MLRTQGAPDAAHPGRLLFTDAAHPGRLVHPSTTGACYSLMLLLVREMCICYSLMLLLVKGVQNP